MFLNNKKMKVKVTKPFSIRHALDKKNALKKKSTQKLEPKYQIACNVGYYFLNYYNV